MVLEGIELTNIFTMNFLFLSYFTHFILIKETSHFKYIVTMKILTLINVYQYDVIVYPTQNLTPTYKLKRNVRK